MKRFLSLVKKTNHDTTTHYPPTLTKVYKVSQRVLGTGSFAIVRLCTHRKTGQTFALKVIHKRAIAGKWQVEHICVCDTNENIGREHMLDNELGNIIYEQLFSHAYLNVPSEPCVYQMS